MIRARLLLCSLGLSSACSGQDTADAGLMPQLSVIQAEIFSPSCSATVCHGGDGPARGLKLDADDVYGELVDVESSLVGKHYVVAGDVDASLLYTVLTEGAEGIRQMPPGAPLSDEKLDLVRTWIEDGANND